MKNSIKYILLVFLGVIATKTLCGKSSLSPSDSFKFECTLLNGESAVSGVVINVLLDGKKVIARSSNKQGNFSLYLRHNAQYTLELVKKGFIFEKVVIETKVPESLLKDKGIEEAIDNQIQLYEIYPGIKTEIFDVPVVYYVYNEKTSYFEIEKKRTKSSQLANISAKISAAKTKLSTEQVKNGNDFLKKKDNIQALIAFSYANELTPNVQSIIDKLKEVQKLVKKESNLLETEYKSSLDKGNGLFSDKKYADSREQYKRAKALKPEELLAQNRIYLIDSLLSKMYNENKGVYEKYKTSGDKNITDKKYKDAISDFEQAQKLLPDETYPAKRIADIKAAIDAEKKKNDDEVKAQQAKLDALIKKASAYVVKKDYANAIAIYNQALQLKPDDGNTLALKTKAEEKLTELAKERLRKVKEKNYNDTIALADSSYNKKDFTLARGLYIAASNIKPEENYPGKKIKDIDLQLKKTVASHTEAKPENVQNTTASPAKASSDKMSDLLRNAQNLEKSGNKIEASKAYADIANSYQEKSLLGKALEFLSKSLKLAVAGKDKATQSVVLEKLASVYYDSGQYKLTINSFAQALEIKKQLGDKKGTAQVLADMGNVLTNVFQYDKAIDAYEEALSINQKLGNREGTSHANKQIAGIYFNQNDYRQSASYYSSALREAELAGNNESRSTIMNSLGVVYYRMGKLEDALTYYNQSIALDKANGNKKNISLTYNNIGNLNFDWNKYEKALDFYQKSLQIKRELNFEEGIAVSLLNIGNAYIELKNLPKAIEFLKSGLEIAQKLKFREISQHIYESLSRIYEAKNDFRNAMDAYKSLSAVGGASNVSDGPLTEMGDMYDRESKTVKQLRTELSKQRILTENESLQNKQKEQQLSLKDLEIKNQKSKTLKIRILLIFTILCLGLAALIALQYRKRYVDKKKFSDVISFQKQQITDSIEYASRIQKAVMPPLSIVQSVFPNSFIFNKPKDIVSGDYFYITVHQNKTYVAVADCTGHGVPGAFMSMLGLSLIKEVITTQPQPISANEVLNQLREAMMTALHQTGRDDEAKDGLDIALCVIDAAKQQLEYSGANNPCYIIRNSIINELKADRMPIGIHPVIKPFNSQTFTLNEGDTIYLFSDGYRDQIGENTLKKFKREQFSNLLTEIYKHPPMEQLSILDQRHTDWRGNMEQTDDIMVMGITI